MTLLSNMKFPKRLQMHKNCMEFIKWQLLWAKIKLYQVFMCKYSWKYYVIQNSLVSDRKWFGETIISPDAIQVQSFDSELNNPSSIEQKFNNLCQLHDTICRLARELNCLWRYPILMTLAYGFVIYIAQLYFMYCVADEQVLISQLNIFSYWFLHF